jgi:hypothetical protein
MGMDEMIGAGRWTILRSVGLWTCGLAIGVTGANATILMAPLAVVPTFLVLAGLAVATPRLAGLAGGLVGYGITWVWLLATSETIVLQSLPPYVGWNHLYGPSWQRSVAAWDDEVQLWMAGSGLLVAAGVVITIWIALGMRSRVQRASAAPSSAATSPTL